MNPLAAARMSDPERLDEIGRLLALASFGSGSGSQAK